MPRKTLREASQEILSQSFKTAQGKEEKFGAGYDRSYAPNPLATQQDQDPSIEVPVDGWEKSGKTDGYGTDEKQSGIGPAEHKVKEKAQYPGATPNVPSQPMQDIHSGKNLKGNKVAKVDDSGVVSEEEEEEGKQKNEEGGDHGNFNGPQNGIPGAKKFLGPNSETGTNKMNGIQAEEEEESAKTKTEEEEEEGKTKLKESRAYRALKKFSSIRAKLHEEEEEAKTRSEEEEEQKTRSEEEEEEAKTRSEEEEEEKTKTEERDAAGYPAGPHSTNAHSETHIQGSGGLRGNQAMDIPNAEPVSSIVKSYFSEKGADNQIKEAMDALFAGEEISPAFAEKAKIIFEAAVVDRTTEICELIEDAYVTQLEEAQVELQEQTAEKVDAYLNYIVEEWTNDNQIAIEQGLRTELAEDFISGLKHLFVEHYMEVPEDKINIIEELATKVDSLEEKLNEEVARNVELKQVINEGTKLFVLESFRKGLTDTQFDKLEKLSEGVPFDGDEKKFAEKIKVLKESYFPANKNSDTKTVDKSTSDKRQLDEQQSIEGDKRGLVEEVSHDSEVNAYANALRIYAGKDRVEKTAS